MLHWRCFFAVDSASHPILDQVGPYSIYSMYIYICIVEGSLEVKLPTIWTDEKQSREEAERRERLEERRVEEKE